MLQRFPRYTHICTLVHMHTYLFSVHLQTKPPRPELEIQVSKQRVAGLGYGAGGNP